MPKNIKELLLPARDYCNSVAAKIIDLLDEEKEGIVFEHKDELFVINGKMLRPSLAYFSFCAVSFSESKSFHETEKSPHYPELLIFGSVIELIHNASLVHDDILDDEQQRRGQPTVNRKFGVRTALLAGDVFYMLAFKLCVQFLKSEQSVAIVKAVERMCQSELTQMGCFGKMIDSDTYKKIIYGKTGALTAVTCSEAARISGADASTIMIFGNIGMHIGILYQLVDDLLDKDTFGNADRYGEMIFAESISALKKNVGKLAESFGKRWFMDLISFFESQLILK